MRSLLFLISFSFALVAQAQIETNFTVKTNTGYEHNIFKFPSTYVDGEGDLVSGSDALMSSFYQQLYARLALKRSWKKSSLSLSFSPQTFIYYAEEDANYSEFFGKLQHQYNFKKYLKLTTSAWYRLKDREGLNADASDLAFPLGYNHYGVYSNLNFRLSRLNRSELRIAYNTKNYDATETSELSYNAFTGKYVFKNIFRRNTGYHHYGFVLDFSNRAFTRQRASGDDTFTWRDISAEVFYKYPISKPIDITAAFSVKNRKDSNQDRFSSSQVSPSLSFRYKTKTWDANVSTSYTLRNYETIAATDINGDNIGQLEYQYLRLNFNIEKSITSKFTLFLDGNIANRDSNRTDVNSIFFRSYEYANVSLGIRYRF